MATLGLDEHELKSVENLVARVAQLSSSIQSFKMDVLKAHPLPHPSSLQASAQILQRNLQTVLDNINENSELFSRMAVRPSTNYPGRAQENVLTQLLRKKLEPNVEQLMEDGRETAALATPEGIASLQDVWNELREWTHTRIAAYVRDEAGDVYTREERAAGTQNARTGLRRNVEDDDDDDDEEDEDEEEEDRDGGHDGSEDTAMANISTHTGAATLQTARGPEPETLLWFASRGDFQVAPNVEYERRVGQYRGLEGVRHPGSDKKAAG